jgi:hypothetical protein
MEATPSINCQMWGEISDGNRPDKQSFYKKGEEKRNSPLKMFQKRHSGKDTSKNKGSRHWVYIDSWIQIEPFSKFSNFF